tara:strand:+ start:1520 stop:2176 length:657 start_codon:yes stop_codon:yes gene_type:complete
MTIEKNILDDIPQVVSSSGGFYNPSKNDTGLFYLDFNQGIPKAVSFKYEGEINPIISKSMIGADIRNYRVKKNILIKFLPNCEIKDDLLFTFRGHIKSIKGIKIYNWKGKPISPKFIKYDQTNVYLNYSESNLEDDSILIEDEDVVDKYRDYSPKATIKRNQSFRNIENLPSSYVEESENINQMCRNCFYWKNGYCELWDARVLFYAWCKSWKKKGIK